MPAEAEIGFEAGEGVGRLRGARLDGLAKFVFPVEIVGGGGDEASVEGFLRGKCFADVRAKSVDASRVLIEARGEAREMIVHGQRAEIYLGERDGGRLAFLDVLHVDAIGGQGQLEKRAGETAIWLDDGEERAGGDVDARQGAAEHAEDFALGAAKLALVLPGDAPLIRTETLRA